MIRISLQNLGKTLLILLSLSLFSCVRSGDEGSSFRIVGLNGESRQLKTRVPELNARILESQGRPVSQQELVSAQSPKQVPQIQQQNQQFVASPNANFGSETPAALKETMQMQSQAEQEKPTYNVAAVNEAEKKPDTATVGIAEKETEIQYDLSESEKPEKKSGKKMKLKSGKAAEIKSESKTEKVENDEEEVSVTDKKKGIFVQTGSFADKNNAKQDFAAMQKFYKGKIEEGNFGDKKIYRVLLGPFSNAKKAKDTVAKIKASGHDAIVVKNK